MAVRETLLIGEPVLRETACEVLNVADSNIQNLITDLKDTLRAENLVGMAAPQIGESVRIFVSEIREGNRRNTPVEPFTTYINPEIVHVSHLSACNAQADETELDWEGGGSIQWIFGKVERATEIRLEYMDETGVSHETELSGLMSRIAQHEMDHLNGILFTDICVPTSLVGREYYLEQIVGNK